MYNVNQLVRFATSNATQYAPAIMTAFGAVGVVGTAVLTGKATFEAADRLVELRHEKTAITMDRNSEELEGFILDDLTRAEAIKAVWPLYIPAATTGAVSIAAIVLAHRVNSKRAAVLAAAYALNEGKLEELQDKVREKFGDKKAEEVRDELAHDQVQKTYDESQVIFSPLDGKVMVLDRYSGRFFWSTVDDVQRAVDNINREINISVSDHATLSDFYDYLSLDRISISDAFGWNINERCEIVWSTTTTPDGKTAVHAFEFVEGPVMNPSSFR